MCDNCKASRQVFSHGLDQDSHNHKNELHNDAFAWGATSIGVGYAQTEEMLSVLELPMPSKRKYKRHEEQVGKVSANN